MSTTEHNTTSQRKPRSSHPDQISGPAGLDPERIRRIGLDPERVKVHAERVRQTIATQEPPTIPILNTCTVNNNGIISWKSVLRFTETDWSGRGKPFLDSAHKYWSTHHLVTLIPAAGAASRYLAALRKFVQRFEHAFPQAAQLAASVHGTSDQRNFGPLLEDERDKVRQALAQLEIPGPLEDLARNTDSFGREIAEKSSRLFETLAQLLTSDRPVFIPERPQHARSSRRPRGAVAAGHEVGPNTDRSRENPNRIDSLQSTEVIRKHWDTSPRRKMNQIGSVGRFHHESRQRSGNQLYSEHWMETILDSGESSSREPHALRLKHAEELGIKAYAVSAELLAHYEGVPKAFSPTTREGDAFLFLKLAEQMSLIPCRGNVVVCPANQTGTFKDSLHELGQRLIAEVRNVFETARTPFAPPWLRPEPPDHDALAEKARGEWLVLEQGENLSTIRFRADGSPFKETDGSYSKVSAGHGELVHIFDQVVDAIPEAECLHIRNIDNVIGTSPERRREIQAPARLFRVVRDCLNTIRSTAKTFESLSRGTGEATALLHSPDCKGALKTLVSLLRGGPEAHLRMDHENDLYVSLEEIITVVGNLFHWPRLDSGTLTEGGTEFTVNQAPRWLATEVLKLLNRPLSVFGTVRKEAGDVGGGPVFARLPDGNTVKLCMEMPHASAADQEHYFGSKGKVTHFNPVLVYFELQTGLPSVSQPQLQRVDFEKLFDDRFWLLASKEYAGEKVCYHETVLYELIGNSATSNLLFVEVPRTLFNPHKTIFESLGQDRRSYGFDETLKAQEERARETRMDT